MKKLSTIITCSLLLAYGAIVGLNNRDPGVTATAAPAMPVMASMPLDLQLSQVKHDTVYINSSQPCNHKERVKEIKVPYAVHDTLYVPVLYIAESQDREDETCSNAKYVVRKAQPGDINYETKFSPGKDS